MDGAEEKHLGVASISAQQFSWLVKMEKKKTPKSNSFPPLLKFTACFFCSLIRGGEQGLGSSIALQVTMGDVSEPDSTSHLGFFFL